MTHDPDAGNREPVDFGRSPTTVRIGAGLMMGVPPYLEPGDLARIGRTLAEDTEARVAEAWGTATRARVRADAGSRPSRLREDVLRRRAGRGRGRSARGEGIRDGSTADETQKRLFELQERHVPIERNSMSRRISQSITPTNEDVQALRAPFVTKGANDPLIAELRQYLRDAAPIWLPKLAVDQELTKDRLAEIKKASAARRSVVERLPEGKARSDALAELDRTDAVVAEMDSELSGVNAFSGIGS